MKKKAEIRKIKIFDNLFRIFYWFYVGNKEDIVNAVVKEFKFTVNDEMQYRDFMSEERIAGSMTPLVHCDGSRINLIHYDKKADCQTISHEILHAISNTLREKGIEHNKETDEVYAYYVGWLTNEFYKNFNKKGKK